MSGNSADGTTTVVIDDLDQNLVYSPISAWERSSQGQGLTGGTFAFSNTENATVTIHVPQNTTAFSWQGFLRSGPALFSVCIDCTGPGAATLVDGHAWNQQSTDVSTTLFTKTGLPNSGHTITITNLLDPRFGNISQITVDSFIISVETAPVVASSSSSTSTSISSSQPTDIPMSSSATVATSTSASPSATTSQGGPSTFRSNANVSTKMSSGVTVGTAFASVFGLLALLVLLWWVVKKKHVYGKVSNGGYGARRPVGDIESSMSSTLRLSPSRKKENSVVQVAFPFRGDSGRGFNQSSNTPRSNGNQSPHSHSQNLPSLTDSSTLGQPGPPAQWGIIPLRLNPTPSPDAGPRSPSHNHAGEKDTLTTDDVMFPGNASDDVDVDFTTPLPSSEIGRSSFTMSASVTVRHHGAESIVPAQTSVSVPCDGDDREQRVREWIECEGDALRLSGARGDLTGSRRGARF